MNTLKIMKTKNIGIVTNPETKLKTKYRLFPIGELPKRFAFIYDEDEDQDGITSWFNYKGFTWVNNNYFSN